MAKQDLMKECIRDALVKEKGGNCSRSYANLAKVIIDKSYFITPYYFTLL
jgi:hypothetical protein